TWKGGDYKEMLWRCATSTTIVKFEKHMDELKNYNKKAHEWLSKIPPQHWSKAYFSGIPCKHAIAVIHDMTDNGMDVGTPEDWVHESYKLQTWINVYSHKTNPVNERDMWSKFDCPTTLIPPKVHPQIGRPPKKRKKSKGEIAIVKGDKITRKVPSQPLGSQQVTSQGMSTQPLSSQVGPSKPVARKRSASEVIQAAQGSQAARPCSQAAPTSPIMKRTKMSACRLTPDKQ
ncbi:hypothetical protein Tco_0467813, partial [Tanacetum coccineum]